MDRPDRSASTSEGRGADANRSAPPPLETGHGAPGGRWLLLAAVMGITLLCLGTGDLVPIEGRVAAVSGHMIASGDYLHPWLIGRPYYDKPLLSYWLVVVAAGLLGGLSEWALRLPAAAAGIFSIWCTYRLARRLLGPQAALAAGWILISTPIFVFWSRRASTEMLNVAFIVGAILWYFERRDRPGTVTYVVFFAILALGAHAKGLVGPALVLVALAPDLLLEGRWRDHLRPSLIIAAGAGAVLYLLPMLASDVLWSDGYAQSGLWMVWRENIVRYFEPFDHKNPVTTYVTSVPLHFLPWTVFLVPALLSAIRRWRSTPAAIRWATLATALMILFLTGSGSRRSYYALPVLPLCALIVAGWVQGGTAGVRWRRAARWVAGLTCAVLLVIEGAIIPAAKSAGGREMFCEEVRGAAVEIAPWEMWDVVLVRAESASAFYLAGSREIVKLSESDLEGIRERLERHPATVLLTRESALPDLLPILPPGRVIVERSPVPEMLRGWAVERPLAAVVPDGSMRRPGGTGRGREASGESTPSADRERPKRP